jgi:hypothetical protein
MRQPAIFGITVRRGVPQSNFSRRKITLRRAALASGVFPQSTNLSQDTWPHSFPLGGGEGGGGVGGVPKLKETPSMLVFPLTVAVTTASK